jgi:hypothetical protein
MAFVEWAITGGFVPTIDVAGVVCVEGVITVAATLAGAVGTLVSTTPGVDGVATGVAGTFGWWLRVPTKIATLARTTTAAPPINQLLRDRAWSGRFGVVDAAALEGESVSGSGARRAAEMDGGRCSVFASGLTSSLLRTSTRSLLSLSSFAGKLFRDERAGSANDRTATSA